jgi:ferric hydroxamate transport system substrate-binding protein
LYGVIFAAVLIASSSIGIAFAQTPSMNSSGAAATAATANATTTTETTANQLQQSSSNSSTDQPRIINHTMGQTEITGTPERIVTLYSVFTGDVRALGVQPIGSVQHDWINGWLTPIGLSLSDNVTDVGTQAEPNLETILQLQPDLIIGLGGVWGVHDELYEELNAIAPTIVLDDTSSRDRGIDQLVLGKQNFMTIADTLNRHDEGLAYLERLEAIYGDAAKKIELAGQNGTKFVMVQAILENDVPIAYVFTENSFTTKVLNKIGLVNEIPDPIDTVDKWYQTGIEGLTTVDKPDTHLFFTYDAGQYDTNPLEKSPLWGDLEFVKDGRAHDIAHARVFGQVIFIEQIVNKVVDTLAEEQQQQQQQSMSANQISAVS